MFRYMALDVFHVVLSFYKLLNNLTALKMDGGLKIRYLSYLTRKGICFSFSMFLHIREKTQLDKYNIASYLSPFFFLGCKPWDLHKEGPETNFLFNIFIQKKRKLNIYFLSSDCSDWLSGLEFRMFYKTC